MSQSPAPALLASDVPVQDRHRRYTATTDSGAHYDVLGASPAGVIVRAYHTGVLGRIVQTGQCFVRGKGAQVRVRFEMARDTGDLTGTLDFGGNRFGGIAPLDVFN